MKVSSKILKRIIREELSLIMEGCGEVEAGGSECSACGSGHECPCDDKDLFSKVEALRVVTAVAQNTACPVTRSALLDVVEDLGVGAGEQYDLEDDNQVDVDWNNPQYGHFRGDIDDLESKDDAFGTGFAMGMSEDFPEEHG